MLSVQIAGSSRKELLENIDNLLTPKQNDLSVLSLGAGVQSSALLLMADRGYFGRKPDYAIFADTGDEPVEVYEWLNRLRLEVKTIPILVVSKSKSLIGDYLAAFEPIGTKPDGSLKYPRASTIPWYTHSGQRKEGKLQRQCTVDYKIEMVRKTIRSLLGYKPRQRWKHEVDMWIGISTDEFMRAKDSPISAITHKYPLLNRDMSRADCLSWLAQSSLPQAPKSSCVYCPYHSDAMWQKMKLEQPEEFERACLVDEQIRDNPKLEHKSYIHRSCIPLREVEFKPKDSEFSDADHFNNECLGMCGV